MEQIQIQMHGSNCSKYVVFKVGEQLFFRANAARKYHKEIVKDFKLESLNHGIEEIECLGGGRILFEPNNSIGLDDYSSDFGQEPDRNLTADILCKAFADHTITIKEDPDEIKSELRRSETNRRINSPYFMQA